MLPLREVTFGVHFNPVLFENANHVLIRLPSPINKGVNPSGWADSSHQRFACWREPRDVHGFQIIQQWLPGFLGDAARTFDINSSWSNDRVHFILLLSL